MPKYKVTATKDVGYSAIIEAPSKDEAWIIAMGDNPDAEEPDWEQTDDGHDWTLENISELEENDKKSLEEKLAELYEFAEKSYPDVASVISMAEDTLRKSK